MRKVLLWLVLALTVAISAMPVFAAGEPTVTATASSMAADGTVVVTVGVHNAVAIKGVAVVPQYDVAAFELVSGTWLVSGAIADFSVASGDGVLAFAGATDLNKAIFTYTLKVKSGVKPGAHTVGCTVVLSDADNQKFTVSGSTTVQIPCSHSFTRQSTDSKYLKQPATCTQQAQYYYSCAVCGQKGTEIFYGPALTHQFDAAWSADATAHWHICQNCGQTADRENHVPGDAATEAAPQTCLVCAYILMPNLGHVHDFTVQWCSDGASHWGQCACGAVDAQQAHHWDDGVVITAATEEQTGACLYTCQVCGYEKTEILEKTQVSADGRADERSDGFLLGLSAGIALTALCCVCLIWMWQRKRKNDNQN